MTVYSLVFETLRDTEAHQTQQKMNQHNERQNGRTPTECYKWVSMTQCSRTDVCLQLTQAEGKHVTF